MTVLILLSFIVFPLIIVYKFKDSSNIKLAISNEEIERINARLLGTNSEASLAAAVSAYNKELANGLQEIRDIVAQGVLKSKDYLG